MSFSQSRNQVFKFRASTLYRVWHLLEKKEQTLLKIVVVVQILLSILDLAGVALIGLIGALSVYGIQSRESGNIANQVLTLLRLDNDTFQSQVLLLSLLAILLLFTKTLTSLWITSRTLRFLSRRGAQLSGWLLRSLLSKKLVDLNALSRQDLIHATTFGIQNLTTGVIGLTLSTVADSAMLIILNCALFIYDPVLATTILLLFLIVGVLVGGYQNAKAFQIGSVETFSHVRSTEVMSEVLETFRESVVRDTRERYVQKFLQLRIDVADSHARKTFMPSASKYLMEISMVLGAFLVAGIQFALYDSKTATAGLAIFFAASSRIAPAVLRIQQGVSQINSYLGQSQVTINFFNSSQIKQFRDRGDLATLQPSKEFSGFDAEVRVNNLTFHYVEGLEKFELKVEKLIVSPNQHIAIVGTSGSGKTTLIDLMLGILLPSSGSVSISGVTPEEAFRRWPGAIAYVPQETVIASTSVLENVALGYEIESVDRLHVIDCLVLAGLAEFSQENESGLLLNLGSSGFKLSGGQKQRLGIARALYTRPRILVMDEATSSLDSMTENDLTESLATLKGQLTLITIAHRLSTVKSADVVLYMDKGRILERGTFQEVRSKVEAFDQQANLLGL